MDLQTKVPIQPTDSPIGYDSKIVLLGSCFVENMGAKLGYFKFRHTQNPFGILFQPLAIENLIQRAVEDVQYQENEVFEQEGVWRCFDAHSDLRSTDKDSLLKMLNQRLLSTREALENASHLILTLGTAWVYEYIPSKKVVANCHKVPQKEFHKKLLSVEAIVASLNSMVGLVQKINPKVQPIFTISPVRHLKDGFVENQQSKAHLISALHHFMANGHNVSYFPSYEIMMDELRDYRFYAKDMVHPNELAVDYIWEKFKSVWISEDSHSIMDEVEAVQKGLMHRPFNPDSEVHKKFETSLRSKITYLQKRYSFMKFE